MTLDSSKWDEDLPADPEEEYQTFLRTLERTEGFRLLFVRCTPAEGEYLITRVKDDLPKKTIEFLRLDKPIENLYEIVERLPKREQINILFVQGLEHSFYEYEQVKFGDTNERDFYSWKGVPRILNHLNQQRERFRDDFKICFVFLLRSFSLKYFIHRAPDFFDWRSTVFEFPTTPELLEQESSRILLEGDLEKYLTLTTEECVKKILEIQELLEEDHKTPSYRASLLVQLGNLLYSENKYDAALRNYNQALQITSDNHFIWNMRGAALFYLDRNEEAINSYDKALELQPDSQDPWSNRGNVLLKLERYEEAITSYNKALEIQADRDVDWNNRGYALSELGRYEEAIASYDKAIEIQPDNRAAWSNRGYALENLGRYEDAVTSYDKALEIKHDRYWTWFMRASIIARMGRSDEAIASYTKVIELKPDDSTAWHNRALALSGIGHYEEAVTGFRKAIELKPGNSSAMSWMCLGGTLRSLGRHEEAIASFDKALELGLNPEHWSWSGRIISLLKLGRYKEVVTSCYKYLLTFRLDAGFREWFERRGAIELSRLGLQRLIPLWTKLLHLSGFRVRRW